VSSSPETAPAAIPVQILVVDDSPENRTALRAILSSRDYRIVEAGSGAEALLRLLEEDFAVLLLDVVMPDMSGFELAAAIKERERTAAVPILFLTGQATDVDLV
jgi:CheY-like chemotaxis protein